MLMPKSKTKQLGTINLAPYIEIATTLISIARKSAGNMFRHGWAATGILLDYGYIEPVLLKAALVHDVVEDLPDFDRGWIAGTDEDGPKVLDLVLQVSKRPGESKNDFLRRILESGSREAMLIKAADRLDNLRDMTLQTSASFLDRYCEESETYVLPMCKLVDTDMVTEMTHLIERGRRISKFRKLIEKEIEKSGEND